MNIPFHKPFYDAADEHALLAPLRAGKLVGDGEHTRMASEKLASLLGVEHVLLTTSCTHALELAMMVLRIGPGDEVIMPSFTFVSTPNCVMSHGGRAVFADVLESTLTIDTDDMQRRITPRTKAIIPVVYAGVSPEMDEVVAVARRHNIAVVEDAAQALGATYKGKPQGTLGDIGCYSFHETKNFSTGEGGAFATSNAAFASSAEIIREKGTNRRQFMMGLVDKYTWVDIGSSYLPSDTTGALLLSQLSKSELIQRKREQIHNRYVAELAVLEEKGLLRLPVIPPHISSNYHIFYVLLRDEATRNEAIKFFRSKHIGTTFHYLPLHLSPVGLGILGYKPGDFPVAESVSGRLLRLPIYPSLTEPEHTYIIETMKEFFKQ